MCKQIIIAKEAKEETSIFLSLLVPSLTLFLFLILHLLLLLLCPLLHTLPSPYLLLLLTDSHGHGLLVECCSIVVGGDYTIPPSDFCVCFATNFRFVFDSSICS
jgi:hypothetical protein